MPVLRIQQIVNRLGLVFPDDLVKTKGLRANDPVHVEVEPVARLVDVAGRLRKYGLTVREWNDATNEAKAF